MSTDRAEVELESERYLELPRFDQARQTNLLRAFASGTEHEAAIQAIADGWSGAKSYRQIREDLDRIGLRQAWIAFLREAVEAELRDWASKHGVPPEVLFTSKRPKSSKSAQVVGLNEADLRAFVRAAVEKMTLHELGQIPIPARLLMKDPYINSSAS